MSNLNSRLNTITIIVDCPTAGDPAVKAVAAEQDLIFSRVPTPEGALNLKDSP